MGTIYSTVEAAAAAGLSYRQLDYWLRAGVLRSSITAADGSGSRRRFSEADVAAARVARQLRDLAVPLQVIALAVERLSCRLEPWQGAVLVTEFGEVHDLTAVALADERIAGYVVWLDAEPVELELEPAPA